jgi:LAO/AO transport system ATPase
MNKALDASLKELKSIDGTLHGPLDSEYEALITSALELEKWPIARLISVFERQELNQFVLRHGIIKALEKQTNNKRAFTLGITGTPGAGKSTLIGELCQALLKQAPEMSIAVLAIDPSSTESGGALLGDRTRVNFPLNDKRLFFRSQASHQDLGGMGRLSYQVHRLLSHIFDLVIIETVGIGQSEIEVQQLADHTMLVMQPLAGDQVQFMKAGIMEVPNSFVINKCDEEDLAKRSIHLLRSSLKLAKIATPGTENETPIFLCSALHRKGIPELAEYVVKQGITNRSATKDQEICDYFIQKWLEQSFGEFGDVILGGTKPNLKGLSYEEAEIELRKSVYLALQKYF